MDNPYRPRGTLIEQSYIEREADTELQAAIKDNDRYPYFLAPRQSGKSSIIERTRSLLASEDLRIIVIDLSLFSQKDLDDFDQFELIFVNMIYKKLGMDEKMESRLSHLSRGPLFLLESVQLLLHALTGRVVICIDELDVLIEKDFKDDFLSQIRALFNERASDPLLKRIQFVLLAAVSRYALIYDPNRSPFNIGTQIILRDFSREQVRKLVAIGNWLEPTNAERASDRIHYWTNGSVFLSQSILEKAYRRRHKMDETQDICELIDDIVMEMIISAPHEVHFRNIIKQLKRQSSLLSKWVDWMNGVVPDTAIKECLFLAGISDEKSPIRNMIYRRIFSGGGILNLIPETSRSFEYDIFLSYSPKDKKAVYALAEKLKREGLRVWLDLWAIQPGDSIDLKIQGGLEQSRNLVLCMSTAFFESVWGTLERHMYLFNDLTNTQRRLIPLLLEDCALPKNLAQIAYIDLRTQSIEAYRILLTACMPMETQTKKLAVPKGQTDHGRLVMDIEHRANATDIDQWADRREAQAMLPRLIRRLVLASIKKVERLHFRSDEGIQFGGWDGIIQAPEGNAFVPDGLSGWELSTSGDFKKMAENNYRKRSANPRGFDPASTSFIFVTARRWPGKIGDEKENWATEKRCQGIWRDVRVYDADDLDTWLEQAPAVDLWFSMLIGKQPVGTIDLSNFWDDWSRATVPPLSLDLVTAGRDNNISKIHEWLHSKPSILGLQADTWEEAIAYFMASLFQLPEEEREQVLAQAIVVKDATAWRQLALRDSSLILIPIFPDRSIVTTAIDKGHHIFFPMDRSEPVIGNTLILPRLHRTEAKNALEAMGINEESKVRDLAVLARRSLGALRRKLAIFPDALTPEWSKKPEIARSLIPVLLAGRWDDKSIADQEAIARLAGCKYSAVREILISWNKKPDPPVRLVEHTWMVAAREDAWLLLAPYLTDDVLEQFKAVVLDVLGELDPQFELPVSERWLANIHGKVPRYSVYLRGGLAETLALMATLSDQCSLSTRSGQEWANNIVSEIFDLITDWKLWASLSSFLPLLAEAAPEVFLETVEHDLSAPSPNLVHLFTDIENHLMQSSPHTGLLWALELLAWPPEYLGEATLLLAKLAQLDPGGKLANRPISSLRGIFLIWHPCTTASLERRMSILDTIRRREPRVAWDLIINVLPHAHDVAFPTAKPEYRNWLPEEETNVPYVEVFKATNEIIRRLLEDARTDSTRWRAIIELLDDIPETEFDTITDSLLTLNLETLPQSNRLQIWGALRDLLSHHLQFPDAKWVLPQVAIERIRQCYARFEPEDPVLKRSWLFSNQCNFPEGGPSRGRERENMINQARIKAVEELFDIGGLPMLLELACQIENVYGLGWILAKSRVFDSQEALLLSQGLGSTEAARRDTIEGLLYGRTAVNGQEWLEGLRSTDYWNKWTSRQRADYYMCLPFAGHTWDALESEEPEIQRLYWLSININGRGDLDPKDCERIISKLTDYGRLGTAVDFMALYKRKLLQSPQFVAEILSRAIQGSDTEKVDWSSLAYEVGELLDLIESSNKIEEKLIAQFEWCFLPLLTNYGRTPKILHKALAENPEFFVDVLKRLYRSEGDEQGEITKEQQVYAHLSFNLLRSWKQPPGINEDGSVNPEKLRSWVGHARELAHANGRGNIADHHIGQVLVHYPSGTDGAWPHEVLRDLIEDIGIDGIEEGISNGIYNGRGVVSRSFSEGGDQERAIAERYRSYASILSDKWPRTARLMRRIAEIYESEARWEDGKAELNEDLMR